MDEAMQFTTLPLREDGAEEDVLNAWWDLLPPEPTSSAPMSLRCDEVLEPPTARELEQLGEEAAPPPPPPASPPSLTVSADDTTPPSARKTRVRSVPTLLVPVCEWSEVLAPRTEPFPTEAAPVAKREPKAAQAFSRRAQLTGLLTVLARPTERSGITILSSAPLNYAVHVEDPIAFQRAVRAHTPGHLGSDSMLRMTLERYFHGLVRHKGRLTEDTLPFVLTLKLPWYPDTGHSDRECVIFRRRLGLPAIRPN